MNNLPTEVLETRRGYAKVALEGTDRTSWVEILSDDGRGYIEVRVSDERTRWLEA